MLRCTVPVKSPAPRNLANPVMWQRRDTQEHTWRVPETPIRSRQPRLTRAADDVRIVADIRDHPSTNEVATTSGRIGGLG
ncbi:hypothetical protein Hamer_G013927 [Homarus americanus]|uniref:Uncharacterized protein n=1 Tax=Homarus americanus TaxID=6706 RepID=A0A8J5K5M0_HOMAM|nr:hypothetical protein Hamer_G013927 [Homarus americanus]